MNRIAVLICTAAIAIALGAWSMAGMRDSGSASARGQFDRNLSRRIQDALLNWQSRVQDRFLGADWSIPRRYRSRLVAVRPPHYTDREIALTFDDGPDPKTTTELLDFLKEKNIKVTFFVLGWRAKKHPELIKRMLNEGHVVGNHTFLHPARPDGIRAAKEFARTQEVIGRAIGRKPTVFRPPYGISSGQNAHYAKKAGLPVVNWTLSSADTGTKSPAAVTLNILGGAKPGDIALFHDTGQHTVTAIPRIVKALEKRGFRFVTVPEMLRNWNQHVSILAEENKLRRAKAKKTNR